MDLYFRFYNGWHLALIGLTLLLPIIPYLWMRKKSEEQKYRFMKVFSFVALAVFLAQDLRCALQPDCDYWELIPLYLCNIGFFLNIIGIFTKSRALFGFSYCFGSLGALAAILLPNGCYMDVPIYDGGTLMFFAAHMMLFAYDISLRSLGLVEFEVKDVWLSTLVFVLFTVFDHFVNLLGVRFGLGNNPNFMFTLDATCNPFLELVYNVFPVKLLYLFLLLPLAIVLAFLMAMPTCIQRLIQKRKKK